VCGYVSARRLGDNLKHRAATGWGVASVVPAALQGRPVKVARGAHDQACLRGRPIRPAGKVMHHGLLAGGIQLENDATSLLSASAVSCGTAEVGRAIHVSLRVSQQGAAAGFVAVGASRKRAELG